MPLFRYVAVDDLGERLAGTFVAENEERLADVLRRQGQYLVSATLADGGMDFSQIRVLERVNTRDLIFFTTQLATITSTGGNLVEGLHDIEAQVSRQGLKRV